MHFKYHRQYLSLGKARFKKLGAIRTHLSCVAIAALITGIFRRQSPRKISSLKAVKLIRRELYD
ncbi:hypothetical protein QUF90_21145 [Desulfococcaceae bacterium HSG9]|nr:hypothetical protein [Desulfococcaceae bacterium HSG9]